MIIRLQSPAPLLTAAVAQTPGGLPALAAWRCCAAQQQAGVWFTPGAVLTAVQGTGWLLPIGKKAAMTGEAACAEALRLWPFRWRADLAAVAAVCRFAGVQTLYLPQKAALRWFPLLVRGRKQQRYLVLRRLPTAGSADNRQAAMEAPLYREAVREQMAYLPAANLIGAALPPNRQEQGWQNWYAQRCTARNKGLGRVLGVGEQQAPVGCIAITGPFPVTEQNNIYLSDLFVQPAARHAGIGRALVQAALAAPVPQETALLLCKPTLRGYYRKIGFTCCGSMLQIGL